MTDADVRIVDSSFRPLNNFPIHLMLEARKARVCSVLNTFISGIVKWVLEIAANQAGGPCIEPF